MMNLKELLVPVHGGVPPWNKVYLTVKLYLSSLLQFIVPKKSDGMSKDLFKTIIFPEMEL